MRPPHHRRPSSARGHGAAPRPDAAENAVPDENIHPVPVDQPVFAQPQPTDDPTKFHIPHNTKGDNQAYSEIDALNKAHRLAPLPFPPPRDLPEPRLTLAQIWGGQGQALTTAITKAGQLVFHSVGDTGSTRGPETQNQVADKMTADFADPGTADRPAFFFHLGDVVYSFGEAQYYYDQFYEPYRDYPAPIVALAGNHDGMISPLTQGVPTLDAYLRNFCAEAFEITPEAGGLSRTAQIQPGVFFTFEAPFLRILCLYSNTLEDPGVIESPEIGGSQIDYLDAALARVKSENYEGALIIAHHHPAFTTGSKHGGSPKMLADIDAACGRAGVWPHAVLSAHAHNYQRFTRHHGTMEIPYITAGNGGHGLARLSRGGAALRAPALLPAAKGADAVTVENYDDQDYGYLRILATATQLRIEYHPASDGAAAKTPDDSVTVDLATRARGIWKG